MPTVIRPARDADLDLLAGIEDAADRPFIERFRPDPDTAFLRALVETEVQHGLDRYGRRVQMTAVIGASPARARVLPDHL